MTEGPHQCRIDQRALAVEWNQKRQLAQRTTSGPTTREQRLTDMGRIAAGFNAVHVRIGAVGDQPVGELHHLWRDIGMVVQANHDGHQLAHRRTDSSQQLTLSVLEVIGHHRTMQVEIDRIQGHGLRQQAHDAARNALEGVTRDHPARTATGP
jgi:hypothetical protein